MITVRNESLNIPMGILFNIGRSIWIPSTLLLPYKLSPRAWRLYGLQQGLDQVDWTGLFVALLYL